MDGRGGCRCQPQRRPDQQSHPLLFAAGRAVPHRQEHRRGHGLPPQPAQRSDTAYSRRRFHRTLVKRREGAVRWPRMPQRTTCAPRDPGFWRSAHPAPISLSTTCQRRMARSGPLSFSLVLIESRIDTAHADQLAEHGPAGDEQCRRRPVRPRSGTAHPSGGPLPVPDPHQPSGPPGAGSCRYPQQFPRRRRSTLHRPSVHRRER